MLRLHQALPLFYSLLFCAAAPAQERFSFFQTSSVESVERMLKLAGLGNDDVVVDLGSGDGLIVMTAARMNPKVRGWGVDVDQKLVDESNRVAEAHGLSKRVQFFHFNAFDVELREATVITMWLFPELLRLLRPTILERARPGTRVLTSTWDFGSWPPDEVSGGNPSIYKWIVPARVGGYWNWELTVAGRKIVYSAINEQNFQSVEGVVRAGSRREVLQNMKLRGEDISFALSMTIDGVGVANHEFTGKVSGDVIAGTAAITLTNDQKLMLPWRATRSDTSDYFAPTGTNIDGLPAD